MPNFMKILLVGAELLHADGHTEMMQLILAFHNLAKAPNKGSHVC